jgi:hypothetical protein
VTDCERSVAVPAPPSFNAVRPVDEAHLVVMNVTFLAAYTLESEVVPGNDPLADEVPPVSWGRSKPGSFAPFRRTSNPENWIEVGVTLARVTPALFL